MVVGDQESILSCNFSRLFTEMLGATHNQRSNLNKIMRAVLNLGC